MAEAHRVTRGEHLSSIALARGFHDYLTVWDDPGNEALRSERNPNVLLPGDVVTIPDKEPKDSGEPTGKRHTFVLRRSPLALRIKIEDLHGRPISGRVCSLVVDGGDKTLTTDGDGLIQASISKTARSAELTIDGVARSIDIGALTPRDDPPGWQARLANLGYLERPAADPESQEVRAALEELQCDQGLPVTGKPTDATLERLETMHGS